ncbi:MAG TPA: ATP-binding protein, partial [Nitrososphaera sp.]|nr:ATP-binding protein [Nitrososphaera sp.]
TAYRREERIGIIDSLEEAASRGVEIKVLVPSSGDNIKEELHDRMRSKGKFEARKIKTALPTEARTKILVIDRKYYLIVEVRDDSKETFLEAVGSAIFSNSVSTVLSYVTMFDSLWRQSELYEKLEEHDKMQREFINVAAHELRTPTQSILGYAELLLDSGKEDINGGHDAEMLKALARNAYRLQGLITDVLDVARIEGGTLRLDKEEFDLIPLVNNVVDDIRRQISTDGKPIDVSYINSVHTNDSQGASVGGELVVTADKGRILQVLSNVLGNALKFTAKGRILIETMTQSNEAVIVRVTDSGMGIDPEIMPKLFEKFASKSEKGTGLGLYISKNIIEAHGGKMSGYNNTDGIGATFAFTLPLATG